MSDIQRVNTPVAPNNPVAIEQYKKYVEAKRQEQARATQQNTKDEFTRQNVATGPQTRTITQTPRYQTSNVSSIKSQKLKSDIAYAVSICSGLAIIAMLVHSMRSQKRIEKMAKDQVKDQMNELVGTFLDWSDFKNSAKKVANINSETTSTALKESLLKIKDVMGLSKAKLEHTGAEEFSNIIYLYGHGGVGKTYVAKQFAQEIDALFTCLKYPDFGSPFKDAASMKISAIFDDIIAYATANKDRKIVVCIDEIDALIRKVEDGAHGANESGKSRAAVLTGIDKLVDECKNITVITTSNYHPKSGLVDPIALRRFTEVEVPLPDIRQTVALLKMYLEKSKNISTIKFFDSKEFKNFAEKLVKSGYSNGEIELICKRARNNFGTSIKDINDADLIHHNFTVKFLEDALAAQGEAASKTNNLMRIRAF